MTDWDDRAAVRPANLPPETDADAPPTKGGPWTKLHEAIDLELRAKLAQIEASRPRS